MGSRESSSNMRRENPCAWKVVCRSNGEQADEFIICWDQIEARVLIELCSWFDSDLTTEVGIRNWNCAALCAANWVRIRMEWPGAWLKFDLGTFMSDNVSIFYLRRAETKCKVVKNFEIGFLERKIWGTKPCLIFVRRKVDSKTEPLLKKV